MSQTSGVSSYGKACVNCTKAKCRCTYGTLGGACERCSRLHKECHNTASIRKQPRQSKRTSPSKTAQLQEKLDDLVTLLKSTAGAGVVTEPLIEQISATQQGSELVVLNRSAPRVDEVRSNPAAAYATTTSSTSEQDDVPTAEAEECLAFFRSQKLKYFPFVHIPSSVTAAELRREQPVLWHGIMATTVKSTARQHRLGIRFRTMIAEQAIVEHQRSLDILLGLLAFLGWSILHVGPRPFLVVYSHLAVAVTQDLGIDRPPAKPNETHPLACIKFHGFVVPRSACSDTRTIQERRAALACYCITSIISTFLKKQVTLPWTGHMEESLKVLGEGESVLDRILIQQVKLQRISEETPKIPLNLELTEHSRLLCDFRTKALSLRLEEIQQDMPKDLPGDLTMTFRLHAIAIQVEIHEIALNMTPSQDVGPDFQRISMLSTCLQLTKTWFDELLSLPPAHLSTFGLPINSQLSYLMLILYRLSTLEDPYWDKENVRKTFDVLQLLEAIATKLAEVPAASGLISDRQDADVFTRTSKAFRHIKATWEGTLVPVQSEGNRPLPDSNASLWDEMDFDAVDGMGDWFTDMYGPVPQ